MAGRDVTCAKWWLTGSTTTEAVMNRNHRIRRMGAALAVFACTLFGLGAWAPAAFASTSTSSRLPFPGGGGPAAPQPAPVHTVAVGGMPGWQIALIAAGAALLAAVVAVLLDRARRARRDVLSAAA
jgi:hypothetical protein